jgi:hypothetical protein
MASGMTLSGGPVQGRAGCSRGAHGRPDAARWSHEQRPVPHRHQTSQTTDHGKPRRSAARPRPDAEVAWPWHRPLPQRGRDRRPHPVRRARVRRRGCPHLPGAWLLIRRRRTSPSRRAGFSPHKPRQATFHAMRRTRGSERASAPPCHHASLDASRPRSPTIWPSTTETGGSTRRGRALSRAMSAKTRADLTGITDDLPGSDRPAARTGAYPGGPSRKRRGPAAMAEVLGIMLLIVVVSATWHGVVSSGPGRGSAQFGRGCGSPCWRSAGCASAPGATTSSRSPAISAVRCVHGRTHNAPR